MIQQSFRPTRARLIGMMMVAWSLFVPLRSSGFAQEFSACAPDITSYWMLDEPGGTTLVDSVGGKNAGCAGSMCPASVPGIINNGLAFDGIEDGVSVPADAAFDWDSADSFSIELWVRVDPSNTCTSNEVFIGRNVSPTSLHWWLGCSDGGVVTFYLQDKNGTGQIATSSRAINNGVWHHIVAVRDGIANRNLLYVDGDAPVAASKTYTAGFDSTTAELNIGWLNLAGGYRFRGVLDEIALYNRALDRHEINMNYYLSRGYCEACSAPVAIMPAGDSITQGVNDIISDSNYMVSYRQKLYLDLEKAQYNIDFVGGLQTGSSASPSFDTDNNGVPGYRIAGGTTGMKDTIYDWLVADPADVVLLHIGTNDLAGGDSIPSMLDGIAAILNEIDRYNPNVTVLLARIINFNPTNPAVTQFNDQVVALARSRIAKGDKIIITDLEHSLSYPDDMQDYLHPSQEGYDKLAVAWHMALQAFLPSCGPLAPVIRSTPVTLAYTSKVYTYDVNATGNPFPTYTLTTAPAGMTIDVNTGLIQWQPETTGNFNVAVRADNSQGSDTQDFVVQVNSLPRCPPDMSHYWMLDETGGTEFLDSVGGKNAGCEVSTCPASLPAIINNGLAFDGIEDGAIVPAGGSFDWGSADSFSIEFWMKTDSSSTCLGNQVIVGRDDSATQLHWWIGCWDISGKASFVLRDTVGNLAVLSGTKDLTDGLWHHLVALRDASTSELSLYVDGAKEGSVVKTYSAGFESATAPVTLGWLQLGGGYHFDGMIDELAVYDRAMNDVEIHQHYTEGVSGNGYCSVGYTITASAGPGGSITPSGTVMVDHGASRTFMITPAVGYRIDDVQVDGKSVGAVNTYTLNDVTANHLIAAFFAIQTYTVTATAGPGGSITPSGTVTVNHGASRTFMITPAVGYRIDDVQVDGKSVGAVKTYTLNNITTNHLVVAKFKRVRFPR